jgi:uncharacterized protein
MVNRFVGRHEERNILNKVKTSQKLEFEAVYGRRRVGKTYLIVVFLNWFFSAHVVLNLSLKKNVQL